MQLTSRNPPSPRPAAFPCPQTNASSAPYTPGSSGTRQTPTPASCSTTSPCCPRGTPAAPDGARRSRRREPRRAPGRWHCSLAADRSRSRGSRGCRRPRTRFRLGRARGRAGWMAGQGRASGWASRRGLGRGRRWESWSFGLRTLRGSWIHCWGLAPGYRRRWSVWRSCRVGWRGILRR